jgi:tetratricopeptide (TPR) repeat protein
LPPAVSACLIVRDEAAFLPDCLRSLAGHVDEIVVVDTGSGDNTPEIARGFGCRLLHDPWRDDFSRPRNLGLDAARGQWILYIDADERISVTGGRFLKSSILDSEAVALRVKFRPRLSMTPYAEYRLFRNDSRIRFTGAMHETIVPGILEVSRENDAPLEDRFDVHLTHLGFEGDQRTKHARNLPLLEKAISELPNRVYLRYHLGATLRAVGETERAIAQLALGIELAGRAGLPRQARVEGSMCAGVLAAIFLDRDEPARARESAENGLRLYADNLALHWSVARALLALGHAEQAVARLGGLTRHDPETFFDPHLAYQRRLFGEHAHSLLGSALFRLRKYSGAAESFERATADATEPLEYQTKARLARRLASGSFKDAEGVQLLATPHS